MKGKKKRMAAAVFLAVMMVMSSAAPAFGASVTVNMRTLKGYENYHNILNWGILPDSTPQDSHKRQRRIFASSQDG